MSTSTSFPIREFWKCNVCRRVFPLLGYLIGHCNQQHPDMHYVCRHCVRAVKKLSDFKRHQLVHSGEKPHLCPHCGKA
ncbi:hypothetical protein CEXT_229371, partial [Caerostris extrusa]